MINVTIAFYHRATDAAMFIFICTKCLRIEISRMNYGIYVLNIIERLVITGYQKNSMNLSRNI